MSEFQGQIKIHICFLSMLIFFLNQDKAVDVEQKEEVEIDVTEVVSQTEDGHHPSVSAEDPEPKQPQENVNPPAETQPPVSEAASPTSTLEPKEKSESTPASSQKTLFVKKEEKVGESCDDPSDSDYMPSRNMNDSVPVLNVQVTNNHFQFTVNVKYLVFACRITVEIIYYLYLIIHELQRKKNQKA